MAVRVKRKHRQKKWEWETLDILNIPLQKTGKLLANDKIMKVTKTIMKYEGNKDKT